MGKTSAHSARPAGWNRARWLAGLLALVAVLAPTHADAQCKQPVYVIAHRCNDPDDPADVVQAHGLNAIEADFSWAFSSWYVEHDNVIVTSTELKDWLPPVAAELQRAGSPLSLIILDIKDPRGDLKKLYKEVREGLGSKVNLIFSFADWTERENFKQIVDLVNADQRAGLAIDYLDEADREQTQQNVEAYFKEIGALRYWFADGYNVTAVTPDSVITNVNAGIALRDANADCSSFHGVYTWTYEDNETIIDFFRAGVNGIFMNADECHFIVGFPDWEIADAVAYAKQNLPDRKFATPDDSAFDMRPDITCPADVTVECSQAGGTAPTNRQLDAFNSTATCSSGYCAPLEITQNPPLLYPVGATTEVTFTATATAPVGSCTPSRSCTASVTVKDTLPPSITCPADIAQDPTSQNGNAVPYNATAGDVCDQNVQVICNPPGGSTFAMGSTTMVTCTAFDASNNAGACSFNVKIYSPQEVVANLKDAVLLLGGTLNQGQVNGLIALLDALLESIDDDVTQAICGQLDGFIDKVTQWQGKGILTAAKADPLLTSAGNLKQTYGCF